MTYPHYSDKELYNARAEALFFERVTVREMFELIDDHKDECTFCRSDHMSTRTLKLWWHYRNQLSDETSVSRKAHP